MAKKLTTPQVNNIPNNEPSNVLSGSNKMYAVNIIGNTINNAGLTRAESEY
ncbi:hypothetical protein DSM16313_27470 [Acinetobacter seohaensis]|nr:hypothetical protein DSM16313_27470 [Acinetobacter seohaensis]